MKINPVVIDFETESIERRPKYPPVPVGVSIRLPGHKKSKYYAWGHPCENNCTKEDAARVLQDLFSGGFPLLFHNSKFDVDVATEHMGCQEPHWERIHDTLYLLFLNDPHSENLALKPSSERLLGLVPEERDAVREWLIEQRVVRASQSDWGAYIARAPGKLVGEYAKGDTDRTLGLFNLLYPQIVEAGMQRAYDTERQLMPILLENERTGLRVDAKKLRADYDTYTAMKDSVDKWIRKKLKSPGLNIDSDADLSERLDSLGIVTEWVMTPTGKRSTAKDNLTVGVFNDKKVASALGYRSRLSTCMATFMENWLDMAEQSNGIIYTNWNQVRAGFGKDEKGARTGRMSSNPNFMNVPTDFYEKDDGYAHPVHIPGLLELPLMRDYILPDKGGVWLHRDYSQQEPRITAHFEDGVLKKSYNEDPHMDVHDFVGAKIRELTGVSLHRKMVKIVNLGIIYGKGLGLLAKELNVSVDEAKKIKQFHAAAFPGLKELETEIKKIGKAGEAITTWGGRRYYAEKPKMINGRMCTFEYKLLNYLIQGSAADCTKRSIIAYHERKKHGRFLVSVHDENNVSTPRGTQKEEMAILRGAMEEVEFDVPILSEGKSGTCWGQLKDFKE